MTKQSRRRVWLFSAVEGFLCFMVLLIAAGGGKAVVKSLVSEDSGQWENLEGALQAIAILLAFVSLYGNRFRSSNGDVASLIRTLKPSFSQDVFLLVATHVVLGFLVLASSNGFPGSDNEPFQALNYPDAVSCATTSAIVWGPIMEELIFRLAIFYVVLHRSGGDVLFTVLLTSGLFGAIHLGNVITAYRQSTVEEEYISFEISGEGNYFENLLDNPNISSLLYTMFQVLGGLGVGLVYTLIFTVSGSITTVILLHMTNNFTAMTTIVRNAALAVVSGKVSQDSNICQPRVTFTVVLVMVLSIGVYITTAKRAWERLVVLMGEPTAHDDKESIENGSVVRETIKDTKDQSTNASEGLRQRKTETAVESDKGEDVPSSSSSIPNTEGGVHSVPTPLYFRQIHGLVYGRPD